MLRVQYRVQRVVRFLFEFLINVLISTEAEELAGA